MPKAKPHRLTLIVRDSKKPDLDWNYRAGTKTPVLFLDSVSVLRFALRTSELDIERVILDRSCDSETYLSLLTALPEHFAGDVALIRDNRSAFLSATGRGGDRVLYSLKADDVRFYLEAHGLVTGRAVIQAQEMERMTA